MIRPDERQLDALLCEIESVVDRLRRGSIDPHRPGKRWSLSAFDLLGRARVRTLDGFGPSGGGGNGSAKKGGDYGGGLVPRLALAPDVNEDRRHWDLLLLDLQVALTYLRRLPAHIEAATPAHMHPSPERLDCCRVCGDPDEPVYRSERCRWDYDRWVEFGVDMPPRIVRWHREGKRITPAMIRAELDEERVG